MPIITMGTYDKVLDLMRLPRVRYPLQNRYLAALYIDFHQIYLLGFFSK